MRKAFTLVEILAAIGVIGLLAAICFPVFSRARANARDVTCVSNVRQLGQATILYCRDFDAVSPLAGDAGDVYTGAWIGTKWEAEMNDVRLLPEVLVSYVPDKESWHCPSDIGFDLTGQFETSPLDAHPSSFEKFGISCAYDSYLSAEQLQISNLVGRNKKDPKQEHGVSAIPLFCDPGGDWHGGKKRAEKRYNYVFCDGHARSINRDQADKAWSMKYTRR